MRESHSFDSYLGLDFQGSVSAKLSARTHFPILTIDDVIALPFQWHALIITGERLAVALRRYAGADHQQQQGQRHSLYFVFIHPSNCQCLRIGTEYSNLQSWRAKPLSMYM